MKRLLGIFVVFFVLFFGVVGLISGQSENASLQPEAGFITIEPVTFYFHFGSYFHRLELTSSEARIWYCFQPADQESAEKPLFIFFNGGPAGATSSGLFSLYTAGMTLDNDLESGGDSYKANPVSWMRLGNLLYIDARTTGFSYNLMARPQDRGARYREFNAQNFNAFIDAADFIRLLLAFLSDHPALQDNRVIIVGESYGGIRTLCMLHILLNYKDYANGTEIYQDRDLVDRIESHYNTVFPRYENQAVPPEIIARQFSHQVLIQPAISWTYQNQVSGEMFEKPGSVIFQVAEEEGVEYVPCWAKPPNVPCQPRDNALTFIDEIAKRDYYIYTQPAGWLWGFFFNAARLLCFTDNLSMVTGVDATGIPGLYAAARTNAYKTIDADYSATTEQDALLSFEQSMMQKRAGMEGTTNSADPGDLSAVFGQLQPWDRYFLDLNYDANGAHHWNVAITRGYDVHYRAVRFGRMFLQNVAHVHTFITNASLDLVVYSKAIPTGLARHTDILASVVHDNQDETPEHRTGKIILTYLPGAFPEIPNLSTRTIRFPLYVDSCHAVSLTQPVALFDDVSAWLAATATWNKREERREKYE